MAHIDFVASIDRLGIKVLKSGTNWYKMTFDELKAISDKNHWVHELDIDNEVDENNDDADIDDTFDNKLEKTKRKLYKIINEKDDEIRDLKRKLNLFEHHTPQIESPCEQQIKNELLLLNPQVTRNNMNNQRKLLKQL